MTDEELTAIKVRADAAPPGPWNYEDWPQCIYGPDTEHGTSGRWIAEADDHTTGEFIAHARTDIPALLAEIAAIREILQAVADGGADRREDEWPKCWKCAFCLGESMSTSIHDKAIVHEPDCPVAKARALLAGDGEEKQP